MSQRTAGVKFAIGDIVSRDGTDRQRVIYIDDEGYAMTVVCTKAPESGWCKVGDEEYNLCRRYDFAGDVIDNSNSRTGAAFQPLLPGKAQPR